MVRRDVPRAQAVRVRLRHAYRPDRSLVDWRGRTTICECGFPGSNTAIHYTAAAPALTHVDWARRAAGDVDSDDE